MKTLLTLALILTATLLRAQDFLPLADSLGKWSQSQLRPMTGDAGSPMLEISTRAIKHFGTTGIIEVKIINRSEQTISATCGLSKANDNVIHVNNSYNMSDVKPNYYVVFKMELRECLPKGRRGMDDLQKIAACQPRLLFPTKTIY